MKSEVRFYYSNNKYEEINNILQSDMDTGSNRKDEKNDSDNISSNSKNNVRKLPNDENGHGTFLAAIAAGREDIDQKI